jgi:hypothetical protein
MPKKNGKPVESSVAYATAADFKQIFTDDVDSLYLLSLLLTADADTAERCFVEGAEESTKRNYVFKEWARSWARRTIIQCAIRLVAPWEFSATKTRTGTVERVTDKIPMALHAEVSAVLNLDSLERFVFVMSVLERYSDNDCSLLLSRTRRDIATARTRAIQQLVTLLDLAPNNRIEADPEVLMKLTIAQHFASFAWNNAVSQ